MTKGKFILINICLLIGAIYGFSYTMFQPKDSWHMAADILMCLILMWVAVVNMVIPEVFFKDK